MKETIEEDKFEDLTNVLTQTKPGVERMKVLQSAERQKNTGTAFFGLSSFFGTAACVVAFFTAPYLLPYILTVSAASATISAIVATNGYVKEQKAKNSTPQQFELKGYAENSKEFENNTPLITNLTQEVQKKYDSVNFKENVTQQKEKKKSQEQYLEPLQDSKNGQVEQKEVLSEKYIKELDNRLKNAAKQLDAQDIKELEEFLKREDKTQKPVNFIKPQDKNNDRNKV